MVSGQWSVVSGHINIFLQVASGQWLVGVGGEWSVVSSQWSVAAGWWLVVDVRA